MKPERLQRQYTLRQDTKGFQRFVFVGIVCAHTYVITVKYMATHSRMFADASSSHMHVLD